MYATVSRSVSAGSRGENPSSRAALPVSMYQKYCAISTLSGSTGTLRPRPYQTAACARAARAGKSPVSLSLGAGTFVSRSRRPKNSANVQFTAPTR